MTFSCFKDLLSVFKTSTDRSKPQIMGHLFINNNIINNNNIELNLILKLWSNLFTWDDSAHLLRRRFLLKTHFRLKCNNCQPFVTMTHSATNDFYPVPIILHSQTWDYVPHLAAFIFSLFFLSSFHLVFRWQRDSNPRPRTIAWTVSPQLSPIG